MTQVASTGFFYDADKKTIVQEIVETENKSSKHKDLHLYTEKNNKTKKFQLLIQPALFELFKENANKGQHSVNHAFALSMIDFIKSKGKTKQKKLADYTQNQKKTKKVCVVVQPELHIHFKEIASNIGYTVNQALMFAMIDFLEKN